MQKLTPVVINTDTSHYKNSREALSRNHKQLSQEYGLKYFKGIPDIDVALVMQQSGKDVLSPAERRDLKIALASSRYQIAFAIALATMDAKMQLVIMLLLAKIAI